ncbi:unnamed protein product, partial [Staurois parvus]
RSTDTTADHTRGDSTRLEGFQEIDTRYIHRAGKYTLSNRKHMSGQSYQGEGLPEAPPTKPMHKHIHPIIVCSQARHTIEQWDAATWQ